jgi:glycosyltransferase involved in cell wall biosynthesis
VVDPVELSVVCPAYQEQAQIATTIASLVSVLGETGRRWQLVVVDDGSTDATLALATRAAVDGVEVLTHTPNRGRGYALRRGIAAARGDVVVCTEADLSWGADVVRMLDDALRSSGADVVIASPWAKGGRTIGVPMHRVMLSRLGNLALTRRFGVATSTGMTRAYRREALRAMHLTRDDKDLHLEVLAEARRLRLDVREVPAVLRWPSDRAMRRGSLRVSHVLDHAAWALGLESVL